MKQAHFFLKKGWKSTFWRKNNKKALKAFCTAALHVILFNKRMGAAGGGTREEAHIPIPKKGT